MSNENEQKHKKNMLDSVEQALNINQGDTFITMNTYFESVNNPTPVHVMVAERVPTGRRFFVAAQLPICFEEEFREFLKKVEQYSQHK